MKTIVILTFVLVGLHLVLAAKSCDKDSECGANECCQKLLKNPIVSRRDVESLSKGKRYPGECHAITPENGKCDTMRISNGHCGCAEGLTCKFFPTTYRSFMSRKRLPGKYFCKKEN